MASAASVASAIPGLPPLPNVSTLGGALGQVQDLERRKQGDPQVQKAQAELTDSLSDASKKAGEIEKKIEGVNLENDVKPWDEQKEAQKYTRSGMQAFGSAGSVFAMIASAFTHRPLVNGLNGAASAMNALYKGDADAYQRGYDAWKENTETALKRHQMQMEEYRDVLDALKTRPSLAQAELQSLTAKYDDQVMARMNESGLLEKMAQLQNARASLGIQMKEAQAKLVPFTIFNDSISEFKKANGKPPSSQEMAQLWQEANTGGATGTAGSVAQMIANYKMAPLSGFTMKTPWGQQVMAQVSTINPSYNAGKFGEVQKALKDFGTGAQGNLMRSANVAISHLGTLRDLAGALQNGDVQTANKISQAFSQEFGQSPPTNFDAAKKIVGDEIVKFVTGGGKASGALADRQEVDRTLSRVNSWEQLSGVIDKSYIPLMAGQLKGLKGQYKSSTGLDDFDDMLAPETKSVLENTHKATTQNGWSVELVK